jgi:hypothetical protein
VKIAKSDSDETVERGWAMREITIELLLEVSDMLQGGIGVAERLYEW